MAKNAFLPWYWYNQVHGYWLYTLKNRTNVNVGWWANWKCGSDWNLVNCFSAYLSYASNTEKRIQACRKAMHSLLRVGFTYPVGLSFNGKTYLRIGRPSVTIVAPWVTSISNICMRQVERAEPSTNKCLLGFHLRHKHSNVLNKAQSGIDKATLSLWYRIFQVDSPTRLVCSKLLSDHTLYDYSVPGTLIDRMIKMKLSHVECLFRKVIPNVIEEEHHEGVVNILRFLNLPENFIKPYSSEHIIACLLTKAFWNWVSSLVVTFHANGSLVATCEPVVCVIRYNYHPWLLVV